MRINIKKYFEQFLKLSSYFLLLCTLIPYLPLRSLPTDLISHFQTYYLAIVIFIFAISLILKLKNISIYLLCIISFVLAFNSLEQYSSHKILIKESPRFKVMQANVFKFNFDYSPLLKQIAEQQPDIIALSETTPKWQAGLKPLEKNWPYVIDQNQWGSHGMIIFSKYPFTSQDTKYLGSTKIPTIFFNVNIDDHDIQFISLHPLPPVCIDCFKSRDTNFDEIEKTITKTKTIVLGDMNTTMYSPSYKKLIKVTGLINARENKGLYPTWPTTMPEFLRIPIDHILHSSDLTTVSFKTLPPIGSDHLATVGVFQ